ncbi:hypothetical protein JZX86_27700 [Agrobacterium rosae]|uniref:hypothetical protein n=1 Tax=Agrobacterium rosae TaxID=1972867 RepID=UPI0019D35516|nr:hypothetical protein [Agrobacterium rosae]MBN7809108.1 hypothetical protein [Agrobacterium rosae]
MHEDFINASLGDGIADGETRVVYDDANKTVVWTRSGNQVIEDTYHKNFQSLLDENQAEANAFSRSGKLGENVKLASVPMSVHMDMQAKGILDDEKAFARFLNDPDFAKFRVNNLKA